MEPDVVEPVVVPEVDAVGFTDEELAGQIGAFDAVEARAYAQRLLTVARLARRRRRRGALASASGRVGRGWTPAREPMRCWPRSPRSSPPSWR